MRVQWTGPAQADLRTIFDFIAADSPFNARRYVNQIIAKTGMLAANPLIGRMVPEVSSLDTRQLIFKNHRIIYQADDNLRVVNILAVVHVRRLANVGLEK